MHNFSPSADRNKQPILEYLVKWLSGDETILEIGSYSGQHAIFFTERLPHINWQCSDRNLYIDDLISNIKLSAVSHLASPIELDVMDYQWNSQQYDVIYTANTLHMMSAQEVAYFMNQVASALTSTGKFYYLRSL